MARIERATSPLPRECSTTEPHGHRHGAGHSLHCLHQVPKPVATDSFFFAYLERETGIEPASLAWKARVLPLNYSRMGVDRHSPQVVVSPGGGGWIRTSVGVSQQIYSLPPLATRAPLRGEPESIAIFHAAPGVPASAGPGNCASSAAGRIGVAVAILAALGGGGVWLLDQATFVTTTDARVRARMVTLSAAWWRARP